MMKPNLRRPGRWAVTSSAAALIIATAALQPASAAPEEIGARMKLPNWGNAAMPGQSSPTDRSTKAFGYTDGQGVRILCQAKGQAQKGFKGQTSLWDLTVRGAWVPDSRVTTKSANSRVIDGCEWVGTPQRRNPRDTNAAIDNAFSRLGATNREDKCLVFVRESFGWYNGSGWATAEIGGDWFAARNRLHGGVPPRGAVVWYHNSRGSGHVAISLGEGLVIGTSVNGRVGVTGYKAHSSYRGWSRPNFPMAS